MTRDEDASAGALGQRAAGATEDPDPAEVERHRPGESVGAQSQTQMTMPDAEATVWCAHA
jgi:hypothetical protein